MGLFQSCALNVDPACGQFVIAQQSIENAACRPARDRDLAIVEGIGRHCRAVAIGHRRTDRRRVAPLGVERFGQTGNLVDLYAAYRLDGAAITEAVAELLLPA